MKKILMMLGLLALTSCNTAPPPYTPALLTFGGNPIRVNVAQIQVVETYQAPLRAPNVEQDFPTPPTEAVKEWLKQRVVAVGSQGILQVTINDASVKEIKLPKTKGVEGLFTDDQDARYDARVAVTFKLFNGVDTISSATADVEVTRSRSINEKATIDDHLKLYDGMTREIMVAFDKQATERFAQYFGAYLK